MTGDDTRSIARHSVDVTSRHGLAVETAGLLGGNPDSVVGRVGNQDVAGLVGSNGSRLGQVDLRVRRRSAIAKVRERAVPADGVDVTGGHCLTVICSRLACD